MSLGAEKFIIKPKEPDELLKILEGVIKNYREGTLVAPKKPIKVKEIYLKQYNERLIQKLEKKMLDLEKSERKYRNLCEYVNELVFSLDEEGRFTNANCKTELFGYTPEDVIGKHFTEILTPKGRDIAVHHFEQAKKNIITRHIYETEIAKKDGSTAIAEISISSIREEEKFIGREFRIKELRDKVKELEKMLKH